MEDAVGWRRGREMWLGVLGSRQLAMHQRIVDFSQAATEEILYIKCVCLLLQAFHRHSTLESLAYMQFLMADKKDCTSDSAPSPAAVDSGTVDIFLLCYLPSPLFHAHWALFVPEPGSPQRGTVLNVRGDPLHGFAHEFERGYIPSEDPEKPPAVLKLGTIAERLVRPDDTAPDGKDTEAHNKLERLALSVDAPGRSLGRGASKDVSTEF